VFTGHGNGRKTFGQGHERLCRISDHGVGSKIVLYPTVSTFSRIDSFYTGGVAKCGRERISGGCIREGFRVETSECKKSGISRRGTGKGPSVA
jgi:hypothetical protein